jgi:pimeloyl-ACP methyl ester carboxylesterase
MWVGFPSEDDDHPVVGLFVSQFKLNPNLTVAGISVPLISSLADNLVNALVGSSSLLGPILLEVINQLTSISADFNPTLLPGANRFCLVAYRERPLVLVPGFAGSRLNQQEGEVWPGFLSGINKTNMAVQPGGVSVFPTSPPDALRHVLEIGNLRVGEIYGGLIRVLKRSLGYIEYDYFNPAQPDDPFKSYQAQRRRFEGAPQLGQDPVPNLFVFAYDWRLNNATSAKLLEEYVKIALFYHPDADGVDLMAHSNGNLVSREYMNTHPGRVARYISLAAPWAGSGKPLAGLLTGDMDDLLLNILIPIRDLRQASQFMPGFHQLMPTKAMFDLGFPVLTLAGFDLAEDGEFYAQYSYDDYAAALEGHMFRMTHAEVGFEGQTSPARANHENFHRPAEGLPISRADGDGPEIEIYQMVGMQSAPQSFAGLRYLGRLHRLATNVENTSLELPFVRTFRSDQALDPGIWVDEADGLLGITTNQFRFQGDLEFLRTLGDGTVPILSLTRGYGSSNGDFNAPHAKLYCAVSLGSASNKEVGHNDLLGAPVLHDWVERALTGRRIQVLDMAVEVPALVGEGGAVNLTASAGGMGVTGPIVTLVDFGDGGSAAQVPEGGGTVNLLYRYRQNGVYTVSVGSTSTNRVTGFTSRSIEVTNIPPTVEIVGGNVTVALNETRIFVAEVTDAGVDDTHTFEWRLNGEALFGQETFAAGLTFGVPGEHQLEVTATDSDGGNATASITVEVSESAAPAPISPLRLAQTGGAKHGPRPHDGEPQVFDAAPEVQVRIKGLAPGRSDTKGVVVRDQSQVFYEIENYQLPLINVPVFNAAILFELRRLVGGWFDAKVQRTATNAATVNVLRQMDVGGEGTFRSFVEFKTLGGPVAVEMLYRQGGQPFQLTMWETNAPADVQVSVSLDWTSLDAGMSFGGQPVPPRHEALGLAAGDRTPPAVAAIFNPGTGLVTVLGQDNFTPSDQLQFFLVQDNSGDGRLTDDVFYELGTNQLARARLPSRPFAIVARDRAGNVTPPVPMVLQGTSDFGYGNPDYCDQLEAIRVAVQEAIQAGLNAEAVNDLFLLDRGHLWVFEQGSGACLWKENSCVACNGNFTPGVSDNDYELFLPTHLERDYQMVETDRLEFLAEDPFRSGMLTGDWYFKPPVGVDEGGIEVTDPEDIVSWLYELPPGFTTSLGTDFLLVPRIAEFTDNLADGYPLALTPAEVIARAFTAAVENDAALSGMLPETTFFPVRREHFMYGTLDLELPPNVGSDPIGDAGMGRQMLLLKWVLEGEFVPLEGALGVNQDLPDLEAVYQNTKTAGVPLAEGLEWGFFQEWAALRAGVTADAYATYGPTGVEQPLYSAAGSGLEEKRRSKLRKLGKAAIRAAFARLAGDPETASAVFDISRQDYLNRGLASFEDYVLFVCTNNAEFAEQVFGEFALPRPTEEGPDLADFLSLKRGDNEALLQEIARLPDGYRLFVDGGVRFLRGVQHASYAAYTNHLAQLDAQGELEERQRRVRNIHLVLQGQPPDRRGLIELREGTPPDAVALVVAVHNYAGRDASALSVNVGSEGELTLPTAEPLAGSANVGLVLDNPVGNGETEVTTLSTQDPAEFQQEPATGDSRLTVTRSALAIGGPDPLELPPSLDLFLNGFDRMLADWAAEGERPRSPRHYLGANDAILVRVVGQPGLGSVRVSGRSALMQSAVEITLPEVSSGIYESRSSGERFAVTGDPAQAARLYLRDEEVLQFEVMGDVGGNGTLSRNVMIDFAEQALTGMPFSGANGMLPGYRDKLQGVLPTLANVTYGELFDNDVASSGQGLANAMGRFILQAGTNNPVLGEADWLFANTHGSADGNLLDHGPPQLVILTPAHLADQSFWRADLDWVFLHSCSTLNDEDLIGEIGAQEWATALRRNERPPHGILGFQGPIDDTPENYELFFEYLDSTKMGMVPAYKKAMETGVNKKPWAAVYYRSAREDRLLDISREPVSTDPIDFDGLDAPTPVCVYPAVDEPGEHDEPGPVAASELVSHYPLRLRPVSPFSPGANAVREPGGEFSQLRRSTQLNRERACLLTEEEAARMADACIAQEFAGYLGSFRRKGIAKRVAGELGTDGDWTRRVYGYLVYYEHLIRGVPVAGDHFTVELDDSGITEIRARILEQAPAAAVKTADSGLWGRPLPEAEALAIASAVVNERWGVSLPPRSPLNLEYVPIEEDSEIRYVAAWRLAVNEAIETSLAGAAAGEVIWIHGVSGDQLSPLPMTRTRGLK